jgi:hypothetical protein
LVAAPANFALLLRGEHAKCLRGPRIIATDRQPPPNLPTNDSALFSFRFRAVHPKDLRDSQLRQLFEVPLSNPSPTNSRR